MSDDSKPEGERLDALEQLLDLGDPGLVAELARPYVMEALSVKVAIDDAAEEKRAEDDEGKQP